MISEPNKIKRAAFAKRIYAEKETFDKMLFTDECTVWLEHESRYGVREIAEDGTLGVKPYVPVAKHTLKVQVWGGISWRGPCPMANFEGNMETDTFLNIIDKVYLPYERHVWPDGLRLMQVCYNFWIIQEMRLMNYMYVWEIA